jgi:toxin FitB
VASIDALLAATALHFELTLVTRNTSDFAPVRVSLLNLWQ